MGGELKPRVTKILKPPKQPEEETGKLRVCAYCRVSSKHDEQRTSYDTQVRVYTEMINANPEWELAGIYADWGITGTQSKKRPEFLRMVADCEAGMIDVIICKSISRFSRNTLDAVNYIRRLKEMGICILFEKEGIDTDSVISEMLLSVLSAFAQEESRSLSENVKWGKRKRAMNGQPPMYPPYGYRKQGEDQMVICPEEAEIVRWIFESYEHGMPIAEITGTLLKNGTPAPRIDDKRTGRWEDSRIWQMLGNVKYAGHILTQKRYTTDFLTGKQVRNTGQLPQYFIVNHHDAIIPQKQFDRVLRILAMKSTSREITEQYPYAGLLKCPDCGKTLWCRKPDKALSQFLFCEGEGACGGFAADRLLTDEAVIGAYNSLDMEAVRTAAQGNDRVAREASLLLETKEKYPVVSSVEFWWLDDHVERIDFGKHRTDDDATITVTWKCGIRQTVPSGVVKPTQNPRHKAALWNTEVKSKKSNKRQMVTLRGADIPYGYRADGDGMVVCPEEADVIRLIFDMYERGDSVNAILKKLMDDEVKPPGYVATGSMTWEKTRIAYFLQNSKYIGEYRPKTWSKRWYRQNGEEDGETEECIHDHHGAIISGKQFERCNAIYRMRLRTPYQSYPFGDLLQCPLCGQVLKIHKLGGCRNERHLCCEGEGACRKFVIPLQEVQQAILKAYREVPAGQLLEIAEGKTAGNPEHAARFLDVKAEHEAFEKVDYWWLDELAESFAFGKHSVKASGLESISPELREDDRVLTIQWRCGITTTVSTGLKGDWQHPAYRAGKWDEFLLKYPERFPELTAEVQRMRSDEHAGE